MNQEQSKPNTFWNDGETVPFGRKGECVVPIIAGLFRISGFGLGAYFARNHQVYSVDRETALSMAEADGVPCIEWVIDDTIGLVAYEKRMEQMKSEQDQRRLDRERNAAYDAVEIHASRLDIEGDQEEKVRRLLISLYEYCGVYAVDLPRQFAEVSRQIESGEIASPEWNKWYGPADQSCAGK